MRIKLLAIGVVAGFLAMSPYFGPGVPHEQWIWIDDLRISTENATE